MFILKITRYISARKGHDYGIRVNQMIFSLRYRMHAIISRSLYIFTQFFTAVYIVEQLVNTDNFFTKILQFLGLEPAVYNREWFQINGL